MQSDAHEVLMGILNSRSALEANISEIIQFEMITTGIHACESALCLSSLPIVTCNSCHGRTETIAKCNHLSLPIYSIQVVNCLPSYVAICL